MSNYKWISVSGNGIVGDQSKKVIRFFVLFLKKHKMVLKITPLLTGDTRFYGSYRVGSLYIDFFRKCSIAKGEDGFNVPEYDLELSQKWRIFLLDNFQKIFNGLERNEQLNIGHEIMYMLETNMKRIPRESRKAINSFKRQMQIDND